MRGVAVLVWAVAAVARAGDWEQVADGEINIRARPLADVPGGREVWAEGDLTVGLRDIQAALVDQESYRHFMPYVTESRVLDGGGRGARDVHAAGLPGHLGS